jgi:hypothetical protein
MSTSPSAIAPTACSPVVRVGAACWHEIIEELDRVRPREAILVPLVALEPRRADRNPCAPLGLGEIGAVTIALAIRVPPEAQVNTPTRVSVREHTDELVNVEVARALARSPRLRACAYLHSHPFARGSTWPSSGPSGDLEGHMLPLLAHNRASGLDASFSFIAVPAPEWSLQGFALDGAGRVIDLGRAEILEDAAELERLLRPPLASRTPVGHVLRRQRREVQRAGLRPRLDELFGGWRRVVLDLGQGDRLVVLVPLDFPEESPRCFAVDRRGVTLELRPPGGPLAPDLWVRAAREAQEVLHGAS